MELFRTRVIKLTDCAVKEGSFRVHGRNVSILCEI
jgi:hypothetical protein